MDGGFRVEGRESQQTGKVVVVVVVVLLLLCVV